MLDDSTGLGERRAVTIVTSILALQALWAFTNKHLPLDAGLWTLQAELVHRHLAGHLGDGWRLIPFPVPGGFGPLVAGLLTTFFSGELAVRMMLTLGAIFLRGFGMVTLFRTLRVRDESVYFLIPVLVQCGLWFTGALPQLVGETIAIWVIAFFVSRNHPSSAAYWIISLGLFFVAWSSALVFVTCLVVIVLIMLEQGRSVHLSQGWLGKPGSLLSLLAPGGGVVLLGFLGGEPLFRTSSSNFLPTGLGRLLFFITPAPNVLEATFRYGDILHGILAVVFGLLLLACMIRAVLLAIEESTWQSASMRGAGYALLVIAVIAALFSPVTFQASSAIVMALVLVMGGSYSGGPAIRRTPPDRLIHTLAIIVLVTSVVVNGFSISAGSAAAADVLMTSRNLISQERETARQDEHINDLRVRFVTDSVITPRSTSGIIAIFSYSATSPIYLYTESDVLQAPWSYQPRGGEVRVRSRSAAADRLADTLAATRGSWVNGNSPAIPIELASADLYADSTIRVLACLQRGSTSSAAFGTFDLSLNESAGVNIEKGEASYRLAIGKLRVGHMPQLASRIP